MYQNSCAIYLSPLILEIKAAQAKDAPKKYSRDYYHWRAQTTRLLATSLQVHPNTINKIVKKIAYPLKRLYGGKEHVFEENDSNKGRDDNLAAIVRSAAALDRVFWQQRAKFEFSRVRVGGRDTKLQFDKSMTTQHSVEEEENMYQERVAVDMIIAPALQRLGTSEGEEFDREFLLCKAVVNV